ncbi:MAG: hypothetical protein JW775_10105, partial [Candidatus Aminicenantes bacterium]|nr:hypothetical protein [Candidatus Aminicenantes bacterium]
CAIGPVVVVDNEYFGHTTLRKVGPIVGKYDRGKGRAKGRPKAGAKKPPAKKAPARKRRSAPRATAGRRGRPARTK